MTFSFQRLKRKLLATAAIASAIAGLSPGDGISRVTQAGQQTDTHKASKAKNSPAHPAKDSPIPFRVGEKLNYQVGWSVFLNAASVQLSVPEKRDLDGWHTWHLRASAHTQGTARNLFTIDDEFDSYSDATTIESRQYETYLSEMGRNLDQILRLIVEGQPNKGPGPAVVVQPGTRDPLGALDSLRTIDWQRTPEWRAPVYDGQNIYEMRAKREAASETVAVAAGSYTAARVSLHMWQHDKEMTGIDFSVWLANDAARTPVLMQAEVPFGSLRIELTSTSK
jgi:hypothetical protein